MDDRPKIEAWAKVAVGLAVLMAVAWIVVAARLGITSVQVHAMLIPTLGAATLFVMAWGLVTTVLRPPVMRRSRTVGFLLLLVVGYVGNVPLIAPPVSTRDWTASVPHHLPFEGEWLTLAGGDSRERNYRATTAALRWAYDFTRIVDGKTHELDGARNEDWHCFGETIYAPAPGKVIHVVNDVVDNVPGEVASDSMFGNHVVLRVDGGEYLYVSHLRHGTIAVEAGDEVSHATVIGECGNSGRSLAPHVTVHAQDRPGFPVAQGLPLRFEAYVQNGEPGDGMPRGETTWQAGDGDVVRNTAPRTSP